jgi:oxygen-independent coproporphyrinogen-3 oxidase
MRAKQPRDYLEKIAAGVPLQQEQRLAAEELPFEFMMNALRLIDGVELRLFAERTGLPVHVLRKPLDAAERSGLIERDHLRVRPTLRGQRFLNDLLQIFLKDSAAT